MFRIFNLLIVSLVVVSGAPKSPQRIVGGSLTTVSQYPFASSLLYSYNLVIYSQLCGGTLLTTSAILSVAHCFYGDLPIQWRVRLGSSLANSGGTVYALSRVIIHDNFNYYTLDNDIALLKTSTVISLAGSIRPASIAGSNYNLADNQPVYAIGWGATSVNGPSSEQLRHVQIWSVNQLTCRARYAELGRTVTDNMLCSGWLDVGGRGQCQGDAGGPLIHNNIIVGINSWGYPCALPRYPGVNTRVSRFTTWIQSNA